MANGVDEALGVGVPLVAWVGWSIMQRHLVNGVGRLVGEDAGGEHRNKFRDVVQAASNSSNSAIVTGM